MDTEYYSLTFSRTEISDVHAALLQRVMLEDDVRREKGLEPAASRPLLERVDRLLRLPENELDKTERKLDDELWEHAWFTFTDEWAWFRARQEVEQELGARRERMDATRLKRMVELRYRRDFDKFVEEIEMKSAPATSNDADGKRKTA